MLGEGLTPGPSRITLLTGAWLQSQGLARTRCVAGAWCVLYEGCPPCPIYNYNSMCGRSLVCAIRRLPSLPYIQLQLDVWPELGVCYMKAALPALYTTTTRCVAGAWCVLYEGCPPCPIYNYNSMCGRSLVCAIRRLPSLPYTQIYPANKDLCMQIITECVAFRNISTMRYHIHHSV